MAVTKIPHNLKHPDERIHLSINGQWWIYNQQRFSLNFSDDNRFVFLNGYYYTCIASFAIDENNEVQVTGIKIERHYFRKRSKEPAEFKDFKKWLTDQARKFYKDNQEKFLEAELKHQLEFISMRKEKLKREKQNLVNLQNYVEDLEEEVEEKQKILENFKNLHNL